MGNLSLKFIYPSFNQMLSSVSPLVTVLMAMAIRRKTYNAWTWISMPVICGGLLVCSTEEVNFNLLGATLVVLATVLRATKSVMQEKLLDPKEKDMDSVSLLFYLAPWAGLFLVIMSLCFEGLEPLRTLFPWRNGVPTTGMLQILVLLSFSGVNACFLNLSGNLVTAYVGAVGLQILGNLKSCMSIVVSVTIFGNPVTPLQRGGVIMCLFGVWLYSSWGGPSKAKEAARVG
jgi:drug/metabolite transporter (DMT)-like permease